MKYICYTITSQMFFMGLRSGKYANQPTLTNQHAFQMIPIFTSYLAYLGIILLKLLLLLTGLSENTKN